MPIELMGFPPSGFVISFFDIRKYFDYCSRPAFTDSMNFY